MRTILEALPNALFPDLQKESDDPGVKSDLLDDDLVRPEAEDELPGDGASSQGRGRKSPLARHLVHTIGPLDRALPVPLGLQLSLEGARVTAVVVDTGFTHQGIERRCLGKSVVDAGLWRVVARAEPGLVSVFALARALERLSGQTPSLTTTRQRQLALDLCTVRENACVLAQPALGGDVEDARAAARAAAALVEGFVAGDVFYAPLHLRRRIASEERAAILKRLADVVTPWRRIAPQRLFGHLEDVGVLDAIACRRLGVTGPALRAAGAVDDEPTIELEAAAPAATLERTGDALARLCTRYDDGTAALERLQQRLQAEEADAAEDDAGEFAAKDGIGTAVVRGPGGGCAVLVSVAGGVVERMRLRPPDLALIAALPRALSGVALDDVAAVVASFGIKMSAVDR